MDVVRQLDAQSVTALGAGEVRFPAPIASVSPGDDLDDERN
jgi:hypothetical protein